MNRLCLLLFVIVIGCTRSPSAPNAEEVQKQPAPITTPVIPGREEAEHSTRFDFQGDMPGVTTVAEFAERHEGVEDSRESLHPGFRRFRRVDLDGVTFESIRVVEARYSFRNDVLTSIELKLTDDPDNVIPTALLEKYGPSDNPNVASYEHAWTTPTSLLFCVRGEFPSVVIADIVPVDKKAN